MPDADVTEEWGWSEPDDAVAHGPHPSRAAALAEAESWNVPVVDLGRVERHAGHEYMPDLSDLLEILNERADNDYGWSDEPVVEVHDDEAAEAALEAWGRKHLRIDKWCLRITEHSVPVNEPLAALDEEE